MRSAFILLLTIGFTAISFAQAPQLNWTRSHGSSVAEAAYHAVELDNGDILVAGAAVSGQGNADGLLMRLTADGDTVWSRTYGNDGFQEFLHLEVNADGDYLLAGNWEPFPGAPDQGWVMKTDADGNVLWEVTRPSGSNTVGRLLKLAATDDGGVVATGTWGHHDGAWVFRVDGNGNLLWEEQFTHPDYPFAFSHDVYPHPDGRITVLAKLKDQTQLGENWLFEIDADRTILWSHVHGDPGRHDDSRTLSHHPDGYLISGASDQTFHLWKTDHSGGLLWSEYYPFPGIAKGFVQDHVRTENAIYLAGTRFGTGDTDLAAVATDLDGTFRWSAFLGRPNGIDKASAVIARDNDLLMVGQEANYGDGGPADVWLVSVQITNQPAAVSMLPYATTLTVPAGGEVVLDVLLTNTISSPTQGDVWAVLVAQNGDRTLLRRARPTLQPGVGMLVPEVDLTVPAGLSPGEYQLELNLGFFPTTIISQQLETVVVTN